MSFRSLLRFSYHIRHRRYSLLKAMQLVCVLGVGCFHYSNPVYAHDKICGSAYVNHPYATVTVGPDNVGAIYLEGITNNLSEPDKLLAVETNISPRATLHRVNEDSTGLRKMKAVGEVSLPPKESVGFNFHENDGYHIMLLNIANKMKVGDKYMAYLYFQKAGRCDIEVWVEKDEQAGSHANHNKENGG